MEEFADIKVFTSLPLLISYVVFMTQFSKGLFDKLIQNKTKYIVLLWSVAFIAIRLIIIKPETIPEFSLELINVAIVWLTAMKSFELVQKK